MDRKIRVAAVDYLNTKPLIWAFEQGQMQDKVELKVDYPAQVARDLMEDKVDVGLVPVAVLPLMKEYHFISDYCIGSLDEVASVCLFSEVAINEIETIYLDYQSRTSVALLKLLLKKYWKISPKLEASEPGFENNIGGNVAALVIGDRALALRNKKNYIYDLGVAWKQMTGLPFVFATWVSNKKLPEDFTKEFNEATGMGFSHLPEIIEKHSFQDYDLNTYYNANLDYAFDEKKKEALSLFLNLIAGGT